MQAIRESKREQYTESLLDYIPRVTPRWDSPTWLAPYVQVLERAIREPIRAVVAAPPQHGKTETTLHALCQYLRIAPERRHAYATYGQQRSERNSTKAQNIARRDGVDVQFRKEYWSNERTGGSILWTSRAGQFTGEPVDGVLVIDDPLKDRQEAESAVIRDHIVDWFDDVAEPRCHETASIIVMATRWVTGDLSGVLVKRGWPYLNLKALAEPATSLSGPDPLGREVDEPLWPTRKPRKALEEKRAANAYSFASLYQGEPRPRGGALFNSPSYYEELPRHGFRVAYGIDLAYTKRTVSDFSVCVELWFADGLIYVVGVDRKQVDAPSFTLTLKARHSARRGPLRWYAGGTEKGAGDFIRQKLPSLQVIPATTDKFIRAQPVAEAWNAGKVLVPHAAHWLDAFLDEVENFTGVNDPHDDMVDALAAGFDLLKQSAPAFDDDEPIAFGEPRM